MPNSNINLVTLITKGISLVATGVSCSLFSLPATAAINFGRSTGVFEAANFWYNPLKSSTSILAFDEEQKVSMPNDTLQVQTLNKWDDINNLQNLDTSGSLVNSHMVYFISPDPKLGRISATANIVFDNPILGFTADYRLFRDTNYLFAPNPTYDRTDTKYGWSLEEAASWTPLDEVIFISDYEIKVNFTTQSAIDGLRVFTKNNSKPVPEPATILGTLTAIGFGSLFKKRISRKNQ